MKPFRVICISACVLLTTALVMSNAAGVYAFDEEQELTVCREEIQGSEQEPEQTPEQEIQQEPEQAPEQEPQQESEQAPEQEPQQEPEQEPQQESQQVPEQEPEQISEQGSEKEPEQEAGKIQVPKLKSVTNHLDHLLVRWTPAKKDVDGIQIEVSKDKDFRTIDQTISVLDPKAKNTKIEELENKALYYVRIRSFVRLGSDQVYSGWSQSMAADYGNVVTSVSITRYPQKMVVGRSDRLEVQINPGYLKGQEAEWESSDPEVASVDNSGRVRARRSGIVKITAIAAGKKTSCRIRVNIKGILTIIDDDGSRDFMTKLLPIIKEKKVSISTAVVPTWAENKKKGFMTWSEIKKCSKGGAEVLCHTLKHHGPAETRAMSLDEITDEYEEAEEMMEEHGYDTGILVYSRSTGKIKKAQKAASNVFKCGIFCTGTVINDTGSNMYFLQRYRLEPYLANDPKIIKGWIDRTKRNGGWMIWSMHCDTAPVNDKALRNLRDIIDYAKKQGVEIVTAKEGYARLVNLTDN